MGSVISFCLLFLIDYKCMIDFHSNLSVIRLTASCSRLGMRLFGMSFAYSDLVAGCFANVFSPILMAHCVHIELQNTFHF